MNMRIIKIADCGKLTAPNTTTLTYNLGIDSTNKTHFRTTDNTTGGLFSTEWIALDTTLDTVKTAAGEKQFSALIFDRLFTYRSANNAGFLVAALLAEDVLQRYKKTKRMLVLGNPDKFLEDIKPLMNSDTNLHDVIAERLEVRKLREIEREKALAQVKQAKARQSQAKTSADKPTKPNTKPNTK
ncbi:MAG: hypothetical protein ACI97K_002535 [Glaciecola sp.]|jgi:hypothetical protein